MLEGREITKTWHRYKQEGKKMNNEWKKKKEKDEKKENKKGMNEK